MLVNRVTVIALLILATFISSVLAQNPSATQASSPSTITASITPEGTVHVMAHGESLQIRMEIYSSSGDLVSDSGVKQGSIIDWKKTDAVQPMTDGSYVVVITVKDFKGNFTQRMTALSLQAGQVQLNPQKRDEVTAAQTQAIETRRQGKKVRVNEGDDAVSILREPKERAVVVTGHDGTNGQVTSTSGGLTLRTGNTFSNEETEQVRIPPAQTIGKSIRLSLHNLRPPNSSTHREWSGVFLLKFVRGASSWLTRLICIVRVISWIAVLRGEGDDPRNQTNTNETLVNSIFDTASAVRDIFGPATN